MLKMIGMLYKRRVLGHLISTQTFERTIIALLIVNAITLGMETSPTIMSNIGGFIHILSAIILAVFVLEIIAKLYVKGWSFFKDPWCVFDFVIVAIALIPATGPFQVLRALRILRILRLASAIPSMRRVVNGLVTAIPGMGSVTILLSMIFYLFAVIATNLYAEKFPEWFGTIGASLYSLFQIMTLESWSMGIVRPVMAEFPSAWLFFVPFILLTSFTVLNLFIGIIVSSMQQDYEDNAQEDRDALHEENKELLVEIKGLKSEIAEIKQLLSNKTA